MKMYEIYTKTQKETFYVFLIWIWNFSTPPSEIGGRIKKFRKNVEDISDTV